MEFFLSAIAQPFQPTYCQKKAKPGPKCALRPNGVSQVEVRMQRSCRHVVYVSHQSQGVNSKVYPSQLITSWGTLHSWYYPFFLSVNVFSLSLPLLLSRWLPTRLFLTRMICHPLLRRRRVVARRPSSFPPVSWILTRM